MLKNKKMPNPLVSICVITYHSEKFVLETLESAKTQTYQNIELIISDDGSTDNTLQLCRDWLAENKDRFVRTELITVEKNTGIPANCNRAVKAAHGEWIKLIAGDDILLDNCITDNVEYVSEHEEVKVLNSQLQRFEDVDGKRVLGKLNNKVNNFYELNANNQFKELLINRGYAYTPTLFINHKIFISFGLFNEKYKLIEDVPFWINTSRNGCKFYLMPKLTVFYRQHIDSVSISLRKERVDLVNKISFRNEEMLKEYFYPYFNLFYKWSKQYSYFIQTFFINKENTTSSRFFYNLFIKYLNPFHYVIYFNTHILKLNEYWILKKSVRDLE